ncbi:gephyrin-like molybdotransferase Glp [Billgrantia endophytica]|uniref:Molybdopterin molybdenumtransferase n=1 Tax=Billgrantia endophytica TaxID=2033802 RepID=A0A2N7UAI7_9GAMM|nr:gephyrin-like molybdotransferase Glp [Halomonas endophytica]PMR77430.1 molybdopterin molybdenumtransferase MoeA [Halomonas endophytica]
MTDLQSIERALVALLKGVAPVASETMSCHQAAGRVLAEPVTARMDVPPFDSSAMDGYALHHGDAGKRLPIAQRITAGSPARPLKREHCARIFTGGELPPGADCVVMQEQVEVAGDTALIPKGIPIGNNVRCRGRDVWVGSPLLDAGTRLEAAALGHLASQGITEVAVRRRPRVALLSTGDELVEPGQPLAPGRIYNSNRPMLTRLLERFGADVTLALSVPDDFQGTCATLALAAQEVDVVISTGGVSVGEEDHVRTALETLGQLDLWRLAIRPGKPLALGRLPGANGSDVRFVGLPGNPVSGFVGAWLFLRPLMGAFLGCPALANLPTLAARTDFATRTGPRRHYMRVTLEFGPTGVVAHAFHDQNSGVLSSCIEADALAVIPPETRIEPGDPIECLWLRVD